MKVKILTDATVLQFLVDVVLVISRKFKYLEELAAKH